MAEPLREDGTQESPQPPSGIGLQTTGNDEENMTNVRHMLVERMDPDSGLIDNLLQLRALTYPETVKIKSEKVIFDRNEKLLEQIFIEKRQQALMVALTDTGQQHLVNFVRGNGVHSQEHGTVWPLREKQTDILDVNRLNLVQVIDPCDLITRLFSNGVLNDRQQRYIGSLHNVTDKAEALLDILRRGSEENYWKTVTCLRESNQESVAEILQNGGVLLQSHVSNEGDPAHVTEEEDRIVEALANILQNATLPQYQRIRERLDLRIMRAKKDQSIVFYFYCKTLEELLHLHQLLTKGEFKQNIAEVFDLLITRRETRVSTVNWSEEEFTKAKTYFENKHRSEYKFKEPDSGDNEKQEFEDTEDDKSCCQCLQETGLITNREPGDVMPCPVCKRLFKIPQEGFHAIQNDSFVEKLIQVVNVSNRSASLTSLCEACLVDIVKSGKDATIADMYCVECKQKLCEECCRHHRKLKLTKNHKLMPIIEHQESEENALAKPEPSLCEFHERKILDIYCAECKTVVCDVCFTVGHRNHAGSHVNKFVDGFRKEMVSSIETVSQCISQTQKKQAELVKIKEDIQQKVEKLEFDVMNRRDELKQSVDTQANSLLQSLHSTRESKLNDIQMRTDDIDSHLLCFQSHSSSCQNILAKGLASDICRAVSDLSLRAFELQQQCQSIIEQEILPFKFCFVKSEFEEFLEDDNLIGRIEEEYNSRQKKTSITELIKAAETLRQELDTEKMKNRTLQSKADKLEQELESEKTTNKTMQVEITNLRQELDTGRKAIKSLRKSKERKNDDFGKAKTAKFRYEFQPALVHTIRTKTTVENKWIAGLTILDEKLFVVRGGSSEVEIYDSTKFSFRGRWKLKELFYPLDIGSCNRNKCLYIFDYKEYEKSKEILRVDPRGKLIKKWFTGDDFGRLSVTDESNVILTVAEKSKINEYSSDGQLIREINLSSDLGIHHPWHAIKLVNGHFVVVHGNYNDVDEDHDDNELHRVCVVDGDRKLQKSYGGKRGSAIGEMNLPIYLAVDRNGLVMVCDVSNSRVLLLDSDLNFKKEILSKEIHKLRQPTRILLNESNNRLFVADNEWDSVKEIYKDGRILIFQFG